MVYSASLNVPVKSALGDKQSQQSNITKIVQNLALSPDVTTMDTVILGPNDLKGPKRQQVQEAIDNKHPDICVIYLYTKDSEADAIDCEYKKKVKQIKGAFITEAFESFVGTHTIRSGRQAVSSADFVSPESDQIEDITTPKKRSLFRNGKKKTKEPPAPPVEHTDDITELEFPEEGDNVPTGEIPTSSELLDLFGPGEGAGDNSESPITETETPIIPEPEPMPELEPVVPEPEPVVKPIDTETVVHEPLQAEPTQLPPVSNPGKLEEYLSTINNFEDWEIFKEKLSHDSVVKNLISECSEYAGLVNMLDVLDQRIATIWRDPVLTATQKFAKIKEIGLERATARACTNSLNVEKAISIISTIILSAKRAVDEVVSNVDTALYKITTDKEQIANTDYIDRAIEERTKVQMQLLKAARAVVDLYIAVDNFTRDEILELDKELPSSNEFINNMVSPTALACFTPTNTKELADSLMKCLQENRIVASQMEECLNALIEQLFALCAKDEELIRYQQDKINLLKAHRVEDVIVVDTLLKNCMRLFVGSDNTGRSSTAITWCGVMSRRQNVLLLDLTGRAKFKDYGVDSVPLAEFMVNRIEQPYLCVEADAQPSPEYIQSILEQLRSRLNYYPCVNIILAPEQLDALDQLSADAKCVHYITNCSTMSITEMAKVVEQHQSPNIARKLVIIDTPVSPLMIADNMGVDATRIQLVTIPNVQAMRACALRHDRPYEYEDIIRIYEEAIR